MSLYQIEVEVNKRKPKVLNPYTPEVIEFREKLEEKLPEWEEFVLSTSKKRIMHRFVKIQDTLVEYAKNRTLMNLTLFLDRKFPGWTRFAMSKAKFKSVPYDDCKVGMLLRPSSSNAKEYIFIEKIQFDKKGHRELVCNQEGKAITYNAKKCKKLSFHLLIEEANMDVLEEVLVA